MRIDFFSGDLYDTWKEAHAVRRLCTRVRKPFYERVIPYLPTSKAAIVVDLGAGGGSFARHLNLADRYENLFLLDGNDQTVSYLKNYFKNVILYTIPDKLPFNSETVSLLHCSHVIEHLQPYELHRLMMEWNRVLIRSGILVISTPLMYYGFYNNLSHVKPYNPNVLTSYLCSSATLNRWVDTVASEYRVLDLVYRYHAVGLVELDEGWCSSNPYIDFLLFAIKAVLSAFGVKKYERSGYTIIMQKQQPTCSSTE